MRSFKHFFALPLIFSISYFVSTFFYPIIYNLLNGRDDVLSLPYILRSLFHTLPDCLPIFAIAMLCSYYFRCYGALSCRSVISAVVAGIIVYMILTLSTFFVGHFVLAPLFEPLFDPSDSVLALQWISVIYFIRELLGYLISCLAILPLFYLMVKFQLVQIAPFSFDTKDCSKIYALFYSAVITIIWSFPFPHVTMWVGYYLQFYIDQFFISIYCIGMGLFFITAYMISQRCFIKTFNFIPVGKIIASAVLSILISLMLLSMIGTFFVIYLLLNNVDDIYIAIASSLVLLVVFILGVYLGCKLSVKAFFSTNPAQMAEQP